MSAATLTRRGFLKVTALAGGGLLLSITLPGCARRRREGLGNGPVDPAIFVRLDPGGTITVTVAKSEMGQGVRTTLAMLVAEELDADWGQVRVEQASYDPKYPDMGTGGSSSIRENWTVLRRAGAALRAMLVAAAAEEWGVDPAECRTERSVVLHPASERQQSYGALADRAARRTVPSDVALKPRSEWRLLGRDRVGVDVADVTHGAARYGLDVRIPEMKFAVIERAPAFGATVKSFDPSKALAVPGVRQVVDLAPLGAGINVHAGVAVVADHTWAALQGRRALTVEWDPGPNAAESSEAYSTFMRGALDHPGEERINKVGDPDGVLARSSGVVTAVFETPFLSHATLEPMNCTASVKGGAAEIWSPTQFPNWAAQAISQALRLEAGNVQVHVTLMGGGFGRRINPDFSVEAALLSQKIGQPVQVVWSREDDLRHDFYRPCSMHRIDASLGADGYPEAWRHRISTPSIDVTYGGKPPEGWGRGEADGAANMSYRIRNRSCEYTLLASGVPRGWWRAVSTTHTVFAVESMIDELAERAGKDPVDYRLALIDQLPAGERGGDRQFAFDPDRLKGVVRLAAEKAGWGRALPAGHGMGIACAFDHLSYAAEVVEVSAVDGRLRIHRVVCAADGGPVLNPLGARAQLEGGVLQGLSAALKERITIADGGVTQRNFDTYSLLRLNEAPLAVESYFVETDTHPTGFGEPAVPPAAPALANAIYRASGQRLRTLPLDIRLA